MIITVTPNTALDRVIFIEKFDRGNPVRTTRWKDSLGGKALDSSVALSGLGVPSILGAVRGGYVDVLVTDESTASTVLETTS